MGVLDKIWPLTRGIIVSFISGDARNGGGGVDSSLVVSMEINGTAYQGVLFAQPARNGGRAMES